MAIRRLDKFRWWVQKTMPAIYEDSLSYYELLSKVLSLLDEMTDTINEQTEEITDLRGDFEELASSLTSAIQQAKADMLSMYNEFTTQMNESFETFTTNIIQRLLDMADEMETQYNTFVNTINHNFSELSTTIMEMLETVTNQFNLYMGNMVDVDIEYEGAIVTKNGTLYTTSNFVADELATSELSDEYKGYRFAIPVDGTTVHCTNFTGLPAGVVGAILTRMEKHSGDLSYAEYVKEIVFSGNANTSFEYRVDYNDFPQGANYLNDFAIVFIVPVDTDINLEYKIKTNQMMVVNLTYDSVNDSYSADKTYAEVVSALNDNIPVYCKSEDLEIFTPVSLDGRIIVLMSRISDTGMYDCLELSIGNTVRYWSQVLWTQGGV